MNAREGFVMGARLLAIYYLLSGVVGIVGQFVYVSGVDTGESTPFLYLPYLAVPTINIFSFIILWIYSPFWAEKMFVVRPGQATEHAGDVFARTVTRLFSLYFVIGGLAGIADFIVFAWMVSDSAYLQILTRSSTWNDLASSIVWLLAGLVIYLGTARVVGAIRHLSNAVADDLWRIKSEDDEPKTQA